MIPLGLVFFVALVTLAVVVATDHMLFFPRFFAYLALYAVSYPLYIAGDALWYWPNLLTCAALVLATNEAINLRLGVLEDEAGRAKAVRWCGVSFGVVLGSFVILLGKTQWNVPYALHLVWTLTLAFCIGRAFVVWAYGAFERLPCQRFAAEHLGLLLAFLVPSLVAMMIRYRPGDAQFYWNVRAGQTAMRVVVMLGWIGMFWPKTKDVSVLETSSD